MCRIRHLGVLCRLGAPMQLSTMVLLGCNRIVIDLDHFDFPVVETVGVADPLNQVLHGVPTAVDVQNGFHIKVVWWHDLLKFQAIEGPLDRFASNIGHHLGHGV